MKKENGKTLNHKLNSGEWIEGEKNHEKRIAIKMTFYRSYAIKVFSFQSICVMLVMATYAPYASYAIILKWISNFLLLVAKTPNICLRNLYETNMLVHFTRNTLAQRCMWKYGRLSQRKKEKKSHETDYLEIYIYKSWMPMNPCQPDKNGLQSMWIVYETYF